MEWLGYILCIFLGALITILVQWLLLVWYIQNAPTGNSATLEPPPDFQLPKNLEFMELWSDNGDCAAAVSLTLQFLFQELKHAPAPLAWLHRKLHQEIIDLLTRTTSGKLFESLTVRNVVAGDGAPRVRWAGVENVEIGSGGYLKTVDLILDIHYSGGFRLTVDAGMLLGKTACFHIEVAHLSGRARVRFTREPYTHWSLSFLSPPHLELHVHPLQKRIAALFQAHARRALQKRHTLPNYTIRYKPFFTKIDPAHLDPTGDDPTIKLQGNFDINIVEVSRLFTQLLTALKIDNRVYCTLSLDSNPWISYRQDEENNTFTIDIVINKERSQQLGTVFKQVNSSGEKYSKSYVIIDTIVPLSAAYKADLRRDDIVIAVDSKVVTGINQIAKIIKGINRPCFSIRIERRAKHYKVFENDKYFKRDDTPKQDSLLVDDTDDSSSFKRSKSNSFSFRKMSEVLDSAKNYNINRELDNKSNSEKKNVSEIQKSHADDISTLKQSNSSTSNLVSFSKHADSLSFGFGLRKRRCSVENKTSSDSSTSSTPTASNPGTPSKRTDKANREQIKSTDALKDPNSLSQIKNSESLNSENYEMQRNDDMDLNDKFINSDGSASTPKISVEKPVDQNKTKADELNDLLQTRMSKILPLSDVIYFQEKFSFKLNRNHRYLNLNIWGKSVNSSDDILLAYLNVPLQTILTKCSNTKMNQCVKKFTLLSPEVNLSVSKNHPLSTHSGFEPCLCYGDVLISFNWSNEVYTTDSKGSQDYKSTPQDSENDCLNEFELVEHVIEDGPQKQKIINDDIPWKSHDFIRTHFNRSTQCDFCRKKIWLKDAVQCRDCAMCCHKKCVSKCQSSVRCPLPITIQQEDNASPSREFVDENIHQMPEFSMTEYISTTDDQISSLTKQSFIQKADEGLLGRNTFSGLLGGLRRVGSAHNLSPLGPSTHTGRSLPPSPHHTPSSRPQSPDEDSAWHALEVAAGDGIKSAADLLKPLLAAHLSSDLLLAKAKDFGPRLLAHLPPDERSERISNLISEIRGGLDEENSKLIELQVSLSSKNLSSQEKAKQSRNMEECEERSQALTALLLHCCSAMQSANKNTM